MSTNASTSAPAAPGLGSAAQRKRRRRILEATITLASQGGYDAVQMRTVAQTADVALGTLYRYFPSKIHLLVSALAEEFADADENFARKTLPGESAADRMSYVLGRVTRSLQRDPHLTEALTRAFMFADASVADEVAGVRGHVTRMLSRAMHEPDAPAAEPTEEEAAVIKVVSDVWLAGVVQWVTGLASAEDVGRSIDIAVRLLLRSPVG